MRIICMLRSLVQMSALEHHGTCRSALTPSYRTPRTNILLSYCFKFEDYKSASRPRLFSPFLSHRSRFIIICKTLSLRHHHQLSDPILHTSKKTTSRHLQVSANYNSQSCLTAKVTGPTLERPPRTTLLPNPMRRCSALSVATSSL